MRDTLAPLVTRRHSLGDQVELIRRGFTVVSESTWYDSDSVGWRQVAGMAAIRAGHRSPGW
jgi:hypothetical protein